MVPWTQQQKAGSLGRGFEPEAMRTHPSGMLEWGVLGTQGHVAFFLLFPEMAGSMWSLPFQAFQWREQAMVRELEWLTPPPLSRSLSFKD